MDGVNAHKIKLLQDNIMEDEFEKSVEIINEVLPKSKYKEFLKLVFSENDTNKLSNGEIQEYLLRITDYNLFIQDDHDDIDIGYHEDPEKSLLATKLSIIFQNESVKIINLDKELKEDFYPYIDGEGNWFVTTEENISFFNDFIDCMKYTIGAIGSTEKRKDFLNNKFKIILDDKKRIEKMESFAKHISNGKYVYKSIEQFIYESKSYNG